MKSFFLYLSVVVLILIIGLGWGVLTNNHFKVKDESVFNERDINKPTAIPPEPTKVIKGPWEVKLLERSNSGISGKAIVTEENTRIKVVIELSQEKEPTTHSANIHEGTCQKIGAVKYELNNVSNGVSKTITPPTLAELKSAYPLAINVTKSLKDKRSIACGELNF